MRIEVVGPEQAPAYTAVHRSSFGSPKFTDERWHAMAAGLPYAGARCLVAYDDQGHAVTEVRRAISLLSSARWSCRRALCGSG